MNCFVSTLSQDPNTDNRFTGSASGRIRTTRHIALFSGLLSLLILSAGCDTTSGGDDPGEPELFKLGDLTANGLTLSAWSEAPLQTGYNEIWLGARIDGEPVELSRLEMMPHMEMEHHSHAAPHESPSLQRDDRYGLYRGWTIFSMPSGEPGRWDLIIEAEGPGGITLSGALEIKVDDSGRVRSFQTDSGDAYLLTWIEPVKPQVGSNELVVALHRMASHTEFPPVENAVIGFEPWMPSMDHGSSNNADPVHQGNGFYKGTVNFNMTGDWELRFDLRIGEQNADRQVIELTF